MTPRPVLAAVLLAAIAGSVATGADRVDLFADDFSRFAPGVLSAPIGTLNGAIQEYHYIEHRGVRTLPWRNPLVHLDTWAAGDDSEGPYLEQHTINTDARFNPLFVTGDPEWRDYTVDVAVRPLSLEQFAGLAVRYVTSRRYYRVALEEGTHLRLAERLPFDREFRVSAWRPIAEASFRYDTRTWYRLTVSVDGNRIVASIDGQPLLDVRDDALTAGTAGLTANMPARFRQFRVTATASAADDVRGRIERREQELRRLRAQNPQPTLWKKFSTPAYGAGRNVRFGDLDGDGRLDMLIAQNVAKVRGDAFDHISCLTAVTLDGKVLWQTGRPNPKNGLLTNDTPFQIHDLDGDGRTEVVLARDFQLQVLDGRTGALLRKTWLPPAARTLENRPYELNVGDSILFVDSDGSGHADDILLKDRYTGVWVFDKALQLKWSGEANTGHYPFPLDIDGDKRDEIAIGYSMWGSDGRRRWGHDDTLKDHADAISIGRFTGRDGEPARVYIDGSDEGFLMLDAASGRILEHHRLGHAQTQSVGRFRTDRPGLQILIANFWRNTGIVTVLDADAKILAQEEMIPGSSHLEPVNWRGDGEEFALLSGNVREGGMIDGHLRRVVMFPDDGHPDLAAAVHDLTGDARDEIVLWDQERVWIYTQDRPFKGERIYTPTRNPTYNASNYRASVSLPGWKTK
jgi:rhamnogalacturonan endolyase